MLIDSLCVILISSILFGHFETEKNGPKTVPTSTTASYDRLYRMDLRAFLTSSVVPSPSEVKLGSDVAFTKVVV
jgi:hypothetical protein